MRKKEQDPNALPNYLLQTLRDCSYSTLKGYIDRGSPKKLFKLSTLGYVTPIQDGYQVTEAGKLYLQTHRRELLKL